MCRAVTTSRHKRPVSHDVRLFSRGHLVAALTGQFEGDVGDPLDFRGGVDLGIHGALLTVGQFGDFLGLAEIDAAGQFADDHDIEAGD